MGSPWRPNSRRTRQASGGSSRADPWTIGYRWRVKVAARSLLLVSAVCSPACRDTPKDCAVEDPWADVTPIPLEPLRLILDTTLEQAVAPARLLAVPMLPSVAVVDPGAGAVHVLDGRYRHDAEGWCVPTDGWELPADGLDRLGHCEVGTVSERRGELGGDDALFAAVGSGTKLWSLRADGGLGAANLDLLSGEPLDWLRTVPVAPATDFVDPGGMGLLGVAPGGTVYAAAGTTAWAWGPGGAAIAPPTLPGSVTDLLVLGDTPWFATTAGLVVGAAADGDGSDDAVVVDRLSPGDDGVWASDPANGQVVRLTPEGTVAERVPVSGVVGPLAADPTEDRVYVVVADGIAVVSGGSEVARYTIDTPVDVLVQPTHELVVLTADAHVQVWFDETTLAGPAPLDMYVAAFFENPKKASQAVPCDGGDTNLAGYVTTALGNHAWMDDTPAAFLLGITPEVVREIGQCGFAKDFSTIWEGSRTEPGVLLHDEPERCEGDLACITEDFRVDIQAVTDGGITPTWWSGAASWELGGADWAQAILGTPAPERLIFFGLSARSDIDQVDPRAKDPFLWQGASPQTAWSVSYAVDMDDPHGGEITAYPGNNIPGFFLGDCAGLLIEECNRVGGGNNAVFRSEDTQVLDLLLHRALAMRSAAGPDTFSFHLPAIELYDYTDGCTEVDGTWSGDECEAAYLQSWLMDVHARFVQNGLATWSLASTLPTVPG